MTEGTIFIWIIVSVIFLLVFLYYVPLILWIVAKTAGINVSLLQLFLIRLRNIPPTKIVNCMILAYKAGLKDITILLLQAHHLAGGNIENVITALIMAKNANVDLTVKQAFTFDLAGKDVLQAVREKIKKSNSASSL